MDYLIVQNQTTVLVGPMPWRPRYFQSEFNDLYDNGDLTTPYTVSQTDPNSYINVGDGIEIYPVSSYVTPDYNSMYQELAGPFWTFDNGGATKSVNYSGLIAVLIEAVKELSARVQELESKL